MKSLANVESFGGTDADNDDILLQAFEDHEAYLVSVWKPILTLMPRGAVGAERSSLERSGPDC